MFTERDIYGQHNLKKQRIVERFCSLENKKAEKYIHTGRGHIWSQILFFVYEIHS